MKKWILCAALLLSAGVVRAQETDAAKKAESRLECAREILNLRRENWFRLMFETAPSQSKTEYRLSFSALEKEYQNELSQIVAAEKEAQRKKWDWADIPTTSWIMVRVQRLTSHGVIEDLYGPNPSGNRPFTRYEIAARLLIISGQFLQAKEKPKWISIPEVRENLQLLCAEFDDEFIRLGVNRNQMEGKNESEISK